MISSVLLTLRILLIILLYTFVFLVFFVLWQTIKKNTKNIKDDSFFPLKLMIQDDQKSMEKIFFQDQISIGRNSKSDLLLENSTVSLEHARFYFSKGQWWVEDFDSTNGTFINTIRILEPIVLSNNDEVSIGKIKINIQILENSEISE